MASLYYVKVYFTKQNEIQSEIRRFAIDISLSNDVFQELCTKIATYQPDIQLNGFTLQYIDEENERITFSTNEELRSAISANKDTNSLKIFVVSKQQESSNDKECHKGVKCDGCQGPVIGFRYKCVVCPNYDLCEKCSSSGVHSEHNMMKITKPGSSYHPYGSRYFHRRHRFVSPPTCIINPDLMEQIQEQIPQWLPNRENSQQIRNHVQHHIDTIKTNTQTHMQNSKQYLENVGQYLQQVLSPFGIDCDYHVDERAKTTTTTTTDNQQSASNNENDQSTTEPKTSTVNNQQQSGISSWLNMFRTFGTNSTNDKSESSDKLVEECVDKMKAMGFNEVNEELIELIRSKQGDINSVLDEINSRQQEK